MKDMDMRLVALLVGTSMLAACGGGGGGVGSAGTTPPPTGGGVTNPDAHTFVNPTQVKTYKGNGAMHRLNATITPTSVGELYAGDASTVRNSAITLTYNPRDAIFELAVDNNPSGVTQSIRFQDPAHRTDFGGAIEPQNGVPNFQIPGMRYLEVGSSGSFLQNGRIVLRTDLGPISSYDSTSFFYQRPGTTTRYVTFAGFLRNSITIAENETKEQFSRGTFVFGEQTVNSNVPRTGTGTYNGQFLATSVLNDYLDVDPTNTTVFQWIEGTSNVGVNFGANSFTLGLDGTVRAPVTGSRGTDVLTVNGGATFAARGSGRIDLVAAGGFLGQFQQAWFINPGNSRFDVAIEGSSIDGAFYGPAAEETGGSFRIVGGTPDERIDILGVFTAARR
jgi:hypothetical protein